MRNEKRNAGASAVKHGKMPLGKTLCSRFTPARYCAMLLPALLAVVVVNLQSGGLRAAPAGGARARLWHFGVTSTPWNDSAFALSPDGWRHYAHDGFMVIGRSDPKVSWPYVQPGPRDWFPGRAV